MWAARGGCDYTYELELYVFAVQGLQDIIHAPHGVGALIKEILFLRVEAKVEDLFPAVATDGDGYAEADIFLSIFTVEGDAASEELLLVADDAFDQCGAGGAGAYQADVPISFVRVAPPTIVSATICVCFSSLRNFVTGTLFQVA